MTKFIKITERYCGRTANPVRYINIEAIEWFGVLDKSEGLVYVKHSGFAAAFAICESLEEFTKLIND